MQELAIKQQLLNLKIDRQQLRMLKQKLSDKFSNIFSRDKKQKQQQKKEQQQFFNQSYFECKLVYNPHRLTLIKVVANIMVGPDAGNPMMVNCKWFIKKNNHYSEIQGVISSYYQPCVEDVGCSVLVQITPLIEGKIYSGATISKETGPLELGSNLQTKFTETKSKLYYQKQSIEFIVRVESVFGKECEYSNLDYPQDGKLAIRKKEDSNFQIEIITNYFKAYFWITKEFPTLQFIRKSYNSAVVSLTQFQSMRLAFKEGNDRQIFALLIRTLTANSTLDWPSQDNLKDVQQQEQTANLKQQGLSIKLYKSQQISVDKADEFNDSPKLGSLNSIQIIEPTEQKSQPSMPKSQEKSSMTPTKQQSQIKVTSQQELTPKNFNKTQMVTPQINSPSNLLELEFKIGELNTELNKIKKEQKDLMKNYNIEKQNKCKLEHQIKKLNDKMSEFNSIQKQKEDLLMKNEKLNNDNRFYRNQLTLLNKDMKRREMELEEAILQKKQLMKKLQKYESGEKQLKKNGNKVEDIMKNEAQNWRKLNNQLVEQNELLKAQIEKLENSLATTNKKIESLYHQKVINSPEKPRSQTTIPTFGASENINKQIAERDKKISNLQFKISNLEMLLKHRSGQKGNETMALHKIINNLTEDITQKSEQLAELKSVNKQLLQKVRGSANK